MGGVVAMDLLMLGILGAFESIMEPMNLPVMDIAISMALNPFGVLPSDA